MRDDVRITFCALFSAIDSLQSISVIRPTLMLLMVAVSVYAQQGKIQPSKRDVKQEDAVAALFEHARKEAGGTTLQRIQRPVLQKLVCTASLINGAPTEKHGRYKLLNDSATLNTPSALYRTSDPAKISPQLERLAAFDRNGKNGDQRFSVAVWTSPSEDGVPDYWVGLQLFFGAGVEFFENHFTDAIEWKNEWKGAVAPQCMDAK